MAKRPDERGIVRQNTRWGAATYREMTPDLRRVSFNDYLEFLKSMEVEWNNLVFDAGRILGDDTSDLLPNALMLCKEIGSQIRDGKFDLDTLVKSLQHEVMEPIRKMLQRVYDLQEKIADVDASAMRDLIKHSTGADTDNFLKMLGAFDGKIANLVALNRGDANNRRDVASALKSANGEVSKAQIASAAIAKLESELEEIVREASRRLHNAADSIHQHQEAFKLHKAIQEKVNQLRIRVQAAKAASVEYNDCVTCFFDDQAKLGVYVGEWHRAVSTIRHAAELFEAAGIEPFEFSEVLPKEGTTWQALQLIPDEEERNTLSGAVPNEFPKIRETRIRERAEGVITQLAEKLKEYEKQVEVPVSKAQPVKASVPQVQATVSAEAGISPKDLAVCAYAAFVKRTKGESRTPVTTMGKTPNRVWNDMLVPAGFQFGMKLLDFEEAAFSAVSEGLLRSLGPHAKTCLQPTVAGFARAEELSSKFPGDFQSKMQLLHTVLTLAAKRPPKKK